MPLPWLFRRSQRRGSSARYRTNAAPLFVRRLERRRVLDASIQSLAVPAMVAEGDTVTATATGTGFGALFFDWSVTQGANTIATGTGPTFNFVAPDDGAYDVVLNLIDAAQSVDTETRTLIVTNVSPVLVVASDQMVSEGELLDLGGIGAPPLGLFIDDGQFDTHTATIDWGDNTLSEDATIFFANGAGALGGMHTYADDGVYEVTVSVTDDDGGHDTESFFVTVKNVNPVAVLSNNGPVDEGSPASVVFTSPFDPSSTDTAAGFRYSYDFDNDGVFDVGDGTYAGSISDATQTVPGGFLDDGPGTYQVRARIIDKNDGSTDYTTEVSVLNVAPTAMLSNDGPVDEGSSASVFFTAEFDPSAADTAAGFRYAYDFDNDGSFEVGDGTYAGSVASGSESVPASFLAEGPGTRTVLARIIDKNGSFTDYTTDIAIVNVAPDLVDIAGDMIDEGDEATIVATIVDPSPLDVFEIDVNWQDGTSDTISGLGNSDQSGTAAGGTTYVWTAATRRLELTHRYLDDGPNPGGGDPSELYSVSLSVRDDDLGTSGPYTADVVVNNVRPVLVVASDQTVDEGAVLDLSAIGAPPLGLFIDDGVLDTHTATVDWGDGSVPEAATIFFADGAGALGGTHIYADDGVYTVTVSVTDDDGGSDTQAFLVTVNNVAPTLSVAETQTIDEGALLAITNLGIIIDPGFNNPANPLAQPGGSVESFSFWVNWGDGTTADTGSAAIDDVGGITDLTDASFDGSHTFADNGTYTVTVRVADDNMSANFTDGMAGIDFVEQTFTVNVENVTPTLAVVENQTIDEGSLLSLVDLGRITDPGFDNPARPGGASFETFTFSINWGDGAAPDMGSATIDDIGGVMNLTDATFDGAHTYADNGTYTVTVRVADDDMSANFASGTDGVDFVEMTFMVTVNNVDPTIPAMDLEVDEGQPFVLTTDLDPGTVDLGVRLTDPGFDNPLNMGNLSNGGEFEETFTSMTIVWGDGSAPEAISIVDRTSGSSGVLTTAGFSHAAHTYADNGVYTVDVTLQDDDGPVVTRLLTLTVNNVAPTVIPIADQIVDESQTFSLPNIGMVTDPGFNNPARPGGASFETFTFSINWDDGTPTDTGSATIDDIGGVMDLTDASFDGSHTYADNGNYTVRLRVADDDMSGDFVEGTAGVDFVEMTFTVTVNNIAPQFEPFDGMPFQPGEPMFQGDDVTATGFTRIRVAFSDPGYDNPLNAGNIANGGETAETFTYIVDWGDGTVDTIDVVFVAGTPQVITSQTSVLASVRSPGDVTTLTTGSFEVQHRYLGPPNPQNPTAPITITLTLMDDDGGMVSDSIEVRNPGIESTNVAIDTTPEIPRLEISPPVTSDSFIAQQTSSTQSLQTPEVRVARGDVSPASERFLELRVVSPDGTESEGIPLEDEVLLDLRRLFAKLPDGHYKIFLIRTDNNTERLLIEVVVRNGRVIEPTDDTEGTRDRPPTGEETIPDEPVEEALEIDQSPEPPADETSAPPVSTTMAIATAHNELKLWAESLAATSSGTNGEARLEGSYLASTLSLAGVALAANSGWSKRIDAALAHADERSWQRLRRAARLGRHFRRSKRMPPVGSSLR